MTVKDIENFDLRKLSEKSQRVFETTDMSVLWYMLANLSITEVSEINDRLEAVYELAEGRC